MAEVTPPLFMDVDNVYSGDELGLPLRDSMGQGVIGYGDLLVAESGTPGMSVAVAAGALYIVGQDDHAKQPNYRCRNDAEAALIVSTSDPTDPRVDRIVATIEDATFAGVSREWRLEVLAGTPTAGATLDNLTGAATVDANSILLADVLVGSGVTSILDADIRDRRPFASRGLVPPLLTDIDQVVPESPYFSTTFDVALDSFYDLGQSAALVYVPRRIVANRIRWRYEQGATPLVGNYVLGIFDASGRKIVDTGSVAFTGAGSSVQARAETITETTFEPGWYYVFWGFDVDAGGAFNYLGNWFRSGSFTRNVALYALTGGLTVPTLLTGLTDMADLPGTDSPMSVPVIALSAE